DDDNQPALELPREQIARRFARYPDGYLVHPDHGSVTIELHPAGTAFSVEQARSLLDEISRLIGARAAELRERRLSAGLAGTFPLFVAQYQAIIRGLIGTSLLVVALVLLSILLFFHDLRSAVSLGVPVLIAVAVTFALTRLVIGYLNSQTAFLGAIVVGNGINYGLVYLARVRQLRSRGLDLA